MGLGLGLGTARGAGGGAPPVGKAGLAMGLTFPAGPGRAA